MHVPVHSRAGRGNLKQCKDTPFRILESLRVEEHTLNDAVCLVTKVEKMKTSNFDSPEWEWESNPQPSRVLTVARLCPHARDPFSLTSKSLF